LETSLGNARFTDYSIYYLGEFPMSKCDCDQFEQQVCDICQLDPIKVKENQLMYRLDKWSEKTDAYDGELTEEDSQELEDILLALDRLRK
jgi:hypothetical protein